VRNIPSRQPLIYRPWSSRLQFPLAAYLSERLSERGALFSSGAAARGTLLRSFR
jgi:hypothetical protein